jgi:CubicO group peptidase (beta-lactamase class C family)
MKVFMRSPISSRLVGLALTFTGASLQAQAGRDTMVSVADRIFEAYRGTDVPGCAVGVSRGGKVVLERGYGMANLETGTPIHPTSIFHVASVSKQFTAMAILLLERDGKLTLDDDIRKYIPEIPSYGATITIRHLLNHTSGLRDQWDLLSMARGRFEENRITEADVMDIVPRQKALNFPPSSEYLYSNTGYTLSAVIVKRVSGKSLRDFGDERIFKPLGMNDTHFHDDYTMIVPRRAMAYATRAGGAGLRVSIPNYDTYGATSLFTTVGDLLTWQANFENPRVGNRVLFDRMETSGRLTSGDSTGYGLGVAVATHRGARYVSHSGGDAGYRSWTGRFPEHGLAIAVACNASTANPQALALGLADAYLASVLTSAPAAEVSVQGVSVTREELERRAGPYFAPARMQAVELTVRDGKLFFGRTGNNEMIPIAPNRFRSNQSASEAIFRDDPRPGFVLRPASGREVTYERKAPMPATRATMAAFAGEYYSEELDATYRIAATDTSITVRIGTSEPFNLRPAFTDAFVGRYFVQFTRDRGRVTGFELTSGRSRRIKFTRR